MEIDAIINHLQSLLERPVDSHKYQYGHVLVIGGSAGMTGAGLLSARAALRAGAGLATLMSDAAETIQGIAPELMIHSLPTADALLQLITDRKVSVLLIGPGLDSKHSELVKTIVSQTDLPTVLDAGALKAYDTSENSHQLVLTPHPGEYRQLSEQQPPIELAQQHLLTLVYKTAPATVYAADGNSFTNTDNTPGLATAGSGDVLAGIIAGLLGQGLAPFVAASAGVYLHGQAAWLAVADKTEPGLIASDIIEYLPVAYGKIGKARPSRT